MSSVGWPERAIDVLLQLDGDPSREMRERWRDERERLVRQPMIDLCHELANRVPAYESFHVWHLHKNPWGWQHQCAVITLARRVEIRLLFDLEGLQVGGGWYQADPGQVDRYRSTLAGRGHGQLLAKIVAALCHSGFAVDGDQMRRPPRGWSADHPHADLARYRTLVATRDLGSPPWLHTAETIDRTLDTCKALRPLTTWLATNINRTAAER